MQFPQFTWQLENNQRHHRKKNEESIHVLNAQVSHKLNFYFSLALNFGMIVDYVYSFLVHDFVKTIMELVSFLHLQCSKCRLVKGSLFAFFCITLDIM